MLKWEKLKPGDVIDVIAPGYATRPGVVEAGLKYLEKKGFVPRIPENLMRPEFFHSNSDEQRLLHLKKALLAKDSKAIWCLRGGYGSNRLIPELAKLKKPSKAKIFLGISDVTSLHLFLNQNWKWNTLHGPLLDRLAENKLDLKLTEELFDIIEGRQCDIHFTQLTPMNPKAKKTKKLTGSVVGGNLTVLQSSFGTPWALKTAKQFLFLEDIGERGYRIDRMLVHLKQAGRLKSCLGILIGQFTLGDEPELNGVVGNRVQEALQRFADENPGLPMWSGVESGHGERLRCMPLGSPAVLEQKHGQHNLNIQTGVR